MSPSQVLKDILMFSDILLISRLTEKNNLIVIIITDNENSCCHTTNTTVISILLLPLYGAGHLILWTRMIPAQSGRSNLKTALIMHNSSFLTQILSRYTLNECSLFVCCFVFKTVWFKTSWHIVLLFLQCNPNLQVFNVFIDNIDERLPRIALFSTRAIHAGEELTFDYKMQSKWFSRLKPSTDP